MDCPSATPTAGAGRGGQLLREGFIVHSVGTAWTQKVAQSQICAYLAVKVASSFMYSPPDDWKIPQPGDLLDKNKSMTEKHREEQRSTLEWLQECSQIKVKPRSRARAKYVPKRP